MTTRRRGHVGRESVMRRSVRLAALAAVLVSLATVAGAQTLVANDDAYGVPFGQPLTVEVPAA